MNKKMTFEEQVLDAAKLLRQETIPATYNPEFDKDKCMDIIDIVVAEWLENKKTKQIEALQPKDCTIKFTLSDCQKGVINMIQDEIHQHKKSLKKDLHDWGLVSVSDIFTYLDEIIYFGYNHGSKECEYNDDLMFKLDKSKYIVGWTESPFKKYKLTYTKMLNNDKIVGYKVTIKIVFNKIKELE